MFEKTPIPKAKPEMGTARSPGRTLQRKCACGGSAKDGSECEECQKQKLQRSADGAAAPPIVHEVLNSPGQPLDQATRSLFESSFGHDFSKVRVHTDQRAAESARALDARAYAFGENLVFAQGEYQPHSTPGQRLLGHELTHVVEGATGIARDKDPTEHPEPELHIGVDKALAFQRQLRPHVPQAPSGAASWSTRVRMAIGSPDAQRNKALLNLMNEALA